MKQHRYFFELSNGGTMATMASNPCDAFILIMARIIENGMGDLPDRMHDADGACYAVRVERTNAYGVKLIIGDRLY